MFFWIYDIPTPLLATLFCAVFVGVTWVGLLLTRKPVRRLLDGQEDSIHLVDSVLSAYGVLYGITLGLISVASYQDYADARSAAAREAAALGALYQDVSGYPMPIREKLQTQLHDYCDYVIDVAWPAHRKGLVPEGGNQRINAIQRTLASAETVTPAQQVLHAETLHQFNELVAARRERLEQITVGLPAALWYVVIAGAIGNIVLVWFLSVHRLSVHLALSGILSAFIGLVVFLIAAMDRPFQGAVGITPEAFEVIRASLTH